MDRPQPVDQVVRKRRFAEQHPEVTFTYDRWHHVHRAVLPEGNGSREVVEQELRALLDRLETLT